MKNTIAENIGNAPKLEELYRSDPREFEKAFQEIAPECDSELVRFWILRLQAGKSKPEGSLTAGGWLQTLGICLLTALLAMIPAIFHKVDPDLFYIRDLPVVIFNGLILAALFQMKPFSAGKWAFYAGSLSILILFVNLLPTGLLDTVNIALIHSPVLLTGIFGLAYISFRWKDLEKRISFVRFAGELVIMTGLLLLAGGLMSAITIGLFAALKMDITRFYMEWLAIPGAAASPVVAWFLIRQYPDITRKIAPVIARIFTPLVMVTLAVYLVYLLQSVSNLIDDRNSLILFNGVLLAVVLIITFAVTELGRRTYHRFEVSALFVLAILAIIINLIALWAIIWRITGGLTPNRFAVLTTNLIIFVHLILLARRLFLAGFRGKSTGKVSGIVAAYLPVYAVWVVIAVFVLPFVFGFA